MCPNKGFVNKKESVQVLNWNRLIKLKYDTAHILKL